MLRYMYIDCLVIYVFLLFLRQTEGEKLTMTLQHVTAMCLLQCPQPSPGHPVVTAMFIDTLQGTPSINPIIYTGCPRRNVPDFGRVFLMLKYTDITQNTYIQSWTVMEIMAREKWGLLAVPNTATCTADTSRDSANDLDGGMQCSLCLHDGLRSQPCYVTTGHSHV